MKEIYHLEKAKQIMSGLNIIIYGTIRDIEKHFLNSFLNLDILTHYFHQIYIIILENDSKDNTRNLLLEWQQSKHPSNIKKHIFLLDHLDEKYPLRAHRLAYCRNNILQHIAEININNFYQYAFHCDLDDRFWSINFDSICNCFQYDLNDWDMMSCINKNYQYYDFWALRCENTWFDKNIFSCEANNIPYESKTGEFCSFLKENKLISVNSAFNGLGIYKLSAMKNCYYSAEYNCNKCHNKNIGCIEDNDHIGLHKQMKEKSAKLFINTNLVITYLPDYAMPYNEYILNLEKKIPNLSKDPIFYLLTNDIIVEGMWLNFGIKDGEIINQISKYNGKNIFCFDEFENQIGKKEGHLNMYTFQKFKEQIKPFLNKNIKIFPGYFSETIPKFEKVYLKEECVSFLNIHSNSYQSTKTILHSLVHTIKNNCIIVFNEFINYPGYFLHEFKAFYEFIQEYNIKFEFIGANDHINMKVTKENKYTKKCILIKIINNPLFNNHSYDYSIDLDFDWNFYICHYDDLKTIKTEEEAWYHWTHYGSKEGRNYKNINQSIHINDSLEKKKFDWIFYISQYDDLKNIQTEEEAWHHWIHNGLNEGRNFKKTTKTKSQQKVENSNQEETKKSIQTPNSIIIDEFKIFDWEYYLYKYSDLKTLKTKEEAWHHWTHCGSKEGRSYDSFDWYLYLQVNPDLGLNGIVTREHAIYHWNHYGKNEGRKYN